MRKLKLDISVFTPTGIKQRLGETVKVIVGKDGAVHIGTRHEILKIKPSDWARVNESIVSALTKN